MNTAGSVRRKVVVAKSVVSLDKAVVETHEHHKLVVVSKVNEQICVRRDRIDERAVICIVVS